MIESHNTDITFNFYNDRVKELLAASIVAEPFTYVPISAGHMELVTEEEGGAVVFGNIKEGYDILDIAIAAAIAYEEIGTLEPEFNLAIDFVQTDYEDGLPPHDEGGSRRDPCLEYREITGVIAIVIPGDVYEGGTYYVNVEYGFPGDITDWAANYTADPGDTMADVKNGLVNSMELNGFEVVAGSPDNMIYMFERSREFCCDPWQSGDVERIFYNWRINAYISAIGFTTCSANLKCGAVHGFGIVYKDLAGRTCSVMKSEDLNIYIPFYTEENSPEIEERPIITFSITHKPPAWAETYEIVYYGNISMDFYFQIRIDSIVDLSPFGLVDHYGANIQDSIDYTRQNNPRWKVSDYEWQEGDRIRLIGYIDEAGAGDLVKYDELYDYEISETGTCYGEAVGGDYLYFQAKDPPASFVGETNIIAEVYRPRKGIAITTPYGTGMVFGIGVDDNGYLYHKGDVDQVLNENGTVTTAAQVICTAHDGYKYVRLNYKHASALMFPFFAESIQPSDWWEFIVSNKMMSIGFPFLDDLSQKQTELPSRIRHGGFIITGTRTNNLAHFVYDGYKDLGKQDGPITGLRFIGYTLKIVQHYKETSIYINRIINFNADGTEEFTLTDRFLGTVYPLETSYGCQHPDSIMVNNRNVYYWDNSQGALIRSAPNGQIALSDGKYKVSRWFKDVVKWAQNNGGTSALNVHIGANNEHEEVWITFRMSSTVYGMIFSEKDGRFKSRIDQRTEAYVHLGNFFAHMYRQRLWIMNLNRGQDYLSWGGEAKEGMIEVVANSDPERNKIFLSTALHANGQWLSENKSIYVPAEVSGVAEDMESNITVWDRVEGVYFGKILKDENSRGNFLNLYDKKLNGRSLRGRYCFLKFTTEEHSKKMKFDSLIVFANQSERNP